MVLESIQRAHKTVDLVLLSYEYLLTFRHELRCLWGQRINPSSLIFASIRLTMFINTVYLLVPATPKASNWICGAFMVSQLMECSVQT